MRTVFECKRCAMRFVYWNESPIHEDLCKFCSDWFDDDEEEKENRK